MFFARELPWSFGKLLVLMSGMTRVWSDARLSNYRFLKMKKYGILFQWSRGKFFDFGMSSPSWRDEVAVEEIRARLSVSLILNSVLPYGDSF